MNALKSAREALEACLRSFETLARFQIHVEPHTPMGAPALARKAIEAIDAAQAEETEADGSAAMKALDEIAALTGCPQWDYPGQLVRDVQQLRQQRDEAVALIRELIGDAPKQPSLTRRVTDFLRGLDAKNGGGT